MFDWLISTWERITLFFFTTPNGNINVANFAIFVAGSVYLTVWFLRKLIEEDKRREINDKPKHRIIEELTGKLDNKPDDE
jgi:hypothetical protein